MNHHEQVKQAHALIGRFLELVIGRLATVWADQNLSLAQIGLLFVLAHAGTASVRQVAERLHISQSAASLLVDRLVRAHLAERSEDPLDRRRAIVRLTPQGEDLMGRNLTGQAYLDAWLNDQQDTRLAIMSETFTALLELAYNTESIEVHSHDLSYTHHEKL